MKKPPHINVTVCNFSIKSNFILPQNREKIKYCIVSRLGVIIIKSWWLQTFMYEIKYYYRRNL